MNTKQLIVLGITLLVVLFGPSLMYYASSIFYGATYLVTGDHKFADFMSILTCLVLLASTFMFVIFNLVEGNIPNPWKWFKQLK